MTPLSRRTPAQRTRSLLAAAAAAALLLTGCGSLGTGNTTTVVRVVDALPGSGGTDFWIGGADFVNNLNFKDLTTYGYINQGGNDAIAYKNGTSTVVVPQQTFNLPQGVFSIVAAGVPGSATTPPAFFEFVDDNSIPPATRFRVRVINLIPDSPAQGVDVTLTGQTTPASTLAQGLKYSTESAYSGLPGDTFTITAKASGAGGVAVTSKTAVALASGHVYTIFLEGLISNSTVTIVPQADI